MDYQLKQRLVGAAVLIGLAVIFVPMVLDGPVEPVEPQRTSGIPLALPDEEVPPLRPERPDPTPPPRETPPPEPAPQESGWAVQLGSFSARDNAEALAERMRKLEFDAFVQRVEVANGTMYRVRIGPLNERETAERLVERVREASGERAVVVPHP